jgi:phosphoribosylglycinamide formyltransferase-1
MPLPRLAIMLSGSGRTLVNLCDAIARGELPAEIGLVIPSKECPGAARARERGLASWVLPGVIPKSRILSVLRDHRVDWVVLAGYLKKVEIPDAYRGRIVNIHPALLPDFGGPGMYGRRVHQAVLDAGMKHTGCTVHLCDDDYDRGPILLQRTCPVLPGDDSHTLAARVFEEEKKAYPEALRRLLAPHG